MSSTRIEWRYLSQVSLVTEFADLATEQHPSFWVTNKQITLTKKNKKHCASKLTDKFPGYARAAALSMSHFMCH